MAANFAQWSESMYLTIMTPSQNSCDDVVLRQLVTLRADSDFWSRLFFSDMPHDFKHLWRTTQTWSHITLFLLLSLSCSVPLSLSLTLSLSQSLSPKQTFSSSNILHSGLGKDTFVETGRKAWTAPSSIFCVNIYISSHLTSVPLFFPPQTHTHTRTHIQTHTHTFAPPPHTHTVAPPPPYTHIWLHPPHHTQHLIWNLQSVTSTVLADPIWRGVEVYSSVWCVHDPDHLFADGMTEAAGGNWRMHPWPLRPGVRLLKSLLKVPAVRLRKREFFLCALWQGSGYGFCETVDIFLIANPKRPYLGLTQKLFTFYKCLHNFTQIAKSHPKFANL